MSASKALSFRKLAVSLAFASGVGTALAARTIIRCFSTASKLRLHLYDHCPFCIRIELVLGTYGIPYERVVYGYGDKKGPTALTGKKILPVLEGAGVPAPQGMKGLPESLDIIAYLTSKYKLPVPCGSDRKDLKHWVSEFDKVRRKLQRPRLIQMKVKDWANDEDVRYAKEKYTKENPNYYEEALKETPKLLEEANRLLMEFETLLKGGTGTRASSTFANYTTML